MPEFGVIREWQERLPGLEGLWALTKGRPEVRIGVLDGPVDESLISQAGDLSDGVVRHGTHVYSIISGTADGTVPGIAPGCTVLSIPVFEASQDGARQICSQEELAAGVRAALNLGCSVVNISASQQADLLSLSSDLNAALQEAADQDVLIVAATGNQGCRCDTIPASVPGVLAVGAHGADGLPLLASNSGQRHRAQGIVAPGNDIPGACVGGGLCRATGTSFAAATVSGVAGLLMSLDLERGHAPKRSENEASAHRVQQTASGRPNRNGIRVSFRTIGRSKRNEAHVGAMFNDQDAGGEFHGHSFGRD